MMVPQKSTIIFLVCLIPFITIGQDWHPFVEGKVYTWSQQVEGKTILESITVETDDYQGSNILFLHSIICDFWDSETAYEMYRNSKSLVNYDKPAIATRQGDEFIISDFSKEFWGWYEFEFKPFVHQGDTWVTNGLEFVCNLESVELVFGQPDSVKKFKCLTAPHDTIEIVLSKSHGFLQYPPLRNLHDTALVASRPYFVLSGTRDQQYTGGVPQPQFEDYFQLDIGDVLVWRDVFSVSSIRDTTYQVDTILAVTKTDDEIVYHTSRASYNEDWNLIESKSHELSYTKEFIGTILEGPSSWMIPNGFIYLLSPLEIIINGGDTNIIADFRNTASFLDPSMCYTNIVYDVGAAWSFSTKKGMIYQYSSGIAGVRRIELIGSIIDGEREGVVDFPTSVSTPRHLELRLYPNPTRGIVYLSNKAVVFEAIDMIDIQGRKRYAERLTSNSIDLSTLAPGLYFVQAIDKAGKKYLGTIIKK